MTETMVENDTVQQFRAREVKEVSEHGKDKLLQVVLAVYKGPDAVEVDQKRHEINLKQELLRNAGNTLKTSVSVARQFLATMKDPCLTVPACTAYIATKAAVKRSTLQTIIKALNRLRAIQRGLPAGVLRLNDDAGFADQVLDHAKQHEEQQLQNFDEDLEQGSDTRILTLQELKEFARTVFDKGACPISSSRMLAVALLSSQMCLRGGDDIPHLRFSAMEVLDAIPAITPTPALPLAIAMVGGKTQGAAAAKTKLGKADRVTYCSLLRHWDPLLDAVGALALYLALHWEPHAHMLLLGTKKEVQWMRGRLFVKGHDSIYESANDHSWTSEHKAFLTALVDNKKQAVLHVWRNTGTVLLRLAGVSKEEVELWCRWTREKNDVADTYYLRKGAVRSLDCLLAAAGFASKELHCNYRLGVELPHADAMMEAVFPGLRSFASAAEFRRERNTAASLRHLATAFWQNFPLYMDAYGAERFIALFGDGVRNVLYAPWYAQFAQRVRDAQAQTVQVLEGGQPVERPLGGDTPPPSAPVTRKRPTMPPLVTTGTPQSVQDALDAYETALERQAVFKQKRYSLGTANRVALCTLRSLAQVVKGMEARGGTVATLESLREQLRLTVAALCSALQHVRRYYADKDTARHQKAVQTGSTVTVGMVHKMLHKKKYGSIRRAIKALAS